MERKGMLRWAMACVCAGALALSLASGCAPQDTAAQEAQAANRQYMSSVNGVAEDLTADLENFADAVSRDDLVSMRTQADNAFKTIDELSELEAPETLLDVHTQYVEGCAKLEQALGDYLTLYTEIESAAETQPFDYSSYDRRLAEIQKLYDAGIAQLEAADKLAAEKE